MNILLVNQDWFAAEFKMLGHNVLSVGRSHHLDIQQNKFLISWTELKDLLPKDFTPDLLIVYDNSMPVLITELETIEIPSVFYSVDTHHHLSYHRYLGLIFTNLFVAQKDYIKEFSEYKITPEWLPLWASIYMEPDEEKQYGAVFIGTLNPALNPERVRFFEELKKIVPVDTRTAAFTDIFPKSRIVINQTVKGDLNFRVFEAMMSGALLITERSGNGLSDLFEDGKHLILYTKGDVQEAADKIKYYLDNPDEAHRIGMAGRALICEKHLAIHRAQFLLEQLQYQTRPTQCAHSFAAIQNFATLASNLRATGEKLWSVRASLEVMRIIQLGMNSSDKIDSVLALDIARTLIALEGILNKEVIQKVLDDLRNSHPDMTILHLVKINQLVSSGKVELAHELSQSLYTLPSEEVVKQAQSIIHELRPDRA